MVVSVVWPGLWRGELNRVLIDIIKYLTIYLFLNYTIYILGEPVLKCLTTPTPKTGEQLVLWLYIMLLYKLIDLPGWHAW